jgi:hypothetical protein
VLPCTTWSRRTAGPRAASPSRFGSGLKGKVLEAWAARVPCAMTPIAADRFFLSPDLAATVAADAAALARLIVTLHAAPVRCAHLARAARAVLRSAFTLTAERTVLAAATTIQPES